MFHYGILWSLRLHSRSIRAASISAPWRKFLQNSTSYQNQSLRYWISGPYRPASCLGNQWSLLIIMVSDLASQSWSFLHLRDECKMAAGPGSTRMTFHRPMIAFHHTFIAWFCPGILIRRYHCTCRRLHRLSGGWNLLSQRAPGRCLSFISRLKSIGRFLRDHAVSRIR